MQYNIFLKNELSISKYNINNEKIKFEWPYKRVKIFRDYASWD